MTKKRWTKEMEAKLREMIAAGASRREMSKALGVSGSAINAKRNRLGFFVDGKKHRPDLDAAILAGFERDETDEQIAARVPGYSAGQVRDRRYGLGLRKRSGGFASLPVSAPPRPTAHLPVLSKEDAARVCAAVEAGRVRPETAMLAAMRGLL